jgi:hypothetical protein
MSLFTRAELLALDPADLLDLLDIADGNNVIEQAQSLGLDTDDGEQWAAVLAAYQHAHGGPEAFSPPIGAGQAGVRSDLTPIEPAMPGPIDRMDDAALVDLSDIEANRESGEALALMMDRSAVTGEPFLAGTFAMYATPSGDVVMVTEGMGMGVKKSVFPRRWVRTALGLIAGEGGLKMKMLGKIFGR